MCGVVGGGGWKKCWEKKRVERVRREGESGVLEGRGRIVVW